MELKLYWWTHYRTPQTWYTFGHVRLNSCRWLTTYRTVPAHLETTADLIVVKRNGELIMGLAMPDQLLVTLWWFPDVPWTIIRWAVSTHTDKPLASDYSRIFRTFRIPLYGFTSMLIGALLWVLSERALLAHQCTFGKKIARFNISQFYLIKINHRVQLIIDIAEFTPRELFSVI